MKSSPKVLLPVLILFSSRWVGWSQIDDVAYAPDYWAIESAAERAKLPLYKTIPAAKPNELTPSNDRPPRSDYRDWYRSHGDHSGSRYSALTQINRSNVKRLKAGMDL